MKHTYFDTQENPAIRERENMFARRITTSATTFRRTGRLRSRDSRGKLHFRAQIAEDADPDDRGEGDGDTSGPIEGVHAGTGGKLLPQVSLAIGHVRSRSAPGQGNPPIACSPHASNNSERGGEIKGLSVSSRTPSLPPRSHSRAFVSICSSRIDRFRANFWYSSVVPK